MAATAEAVAASRCQLLQSWNLKGFAALLPGASVSRLKQPAVLGLQAIKLVYAGNHVRLSGQDVERGTFSHRHSQVHLWNALPTIIA
jgi:Transketolase, pyrimidine binding domain